jgi:hypothetical protein
MASLTQAEIREVDNVMNRVASLTRLNRPVRDLDS